MINFAPYENFFIALAWSFVRLFITLFIFRKPHPKKLSSAILESQLITFVLVWTSIETLYFYADLYRFPGWVLMMVIFVVDTISEVVVKRKWHVFPADIESHAAVLPRFLAYSFFRACVFMVLAFNVVFCAAAFFWIGTIVLNTVR